MPVPIPVSPSSDESNPINESGISALALQSSIPGKQAREAASTLIDLTLFTFSRSLYYITSNRSDGTDIDLTKLV